MNILVVDDEPLIVRLVRDVLERQGHRVYGFTRPAEALSHLAGSGQADLMVVDYKMPEINGLEFIQQAWRHRPGLRVVMITAHGTQEVIAEADRLGVASMVLKPFTPDELARRVQGALDERPARRP